MSTRFEKARFNVATGPASLFERVRFKMSGLRLLKMSSHAIERVGERDIPCDIIDRFTSFSAEEWSVVMAEVRTDRGKFVSSTWEKVGSDKMRYWITIGFNDVIETVVRKPHEKSNGEGFDGVVTDGRFYDFVAKVNRELMDAERLVKPVKIGYKKSGASVRPRFHGPKQLSIVMSRPTWGQLPRIRREAIIVATYTGLNLNLVEKVMSGLPSRGELRTVRSRVNDVFQKGRKYCKLLKEVVDRHPILEGAALEPHSAMHNSFYAAKNLKPVDALTRVVTAKATERSGCRSR